MNRVGVAGDDCGRLRQALRELCGLGCGREGDAIKSVFFVQGCCIYSARNGISAVYPKATVNICNPPLKSVHA